MFELIFGTLLTIVVVGVLATGIFCAGCQYTKWKFYSADDRGKYDSYRKWDRAHGYAIFDFKSLINHKKSAEVDEWAWRKGLKGEHVPKHIKR